MPATTLTSIQSQLAELVGAPHLHPTAEADRIAGVLPQLIAEPATEIELAAILKIANRERLAVIPRGGATKLSFGNPPIRADIILSTARLNKIIEHAWADLTVSVEAGCTIANLQSALASRNQRLAIDVLSPAHATVGGVLATNDSGALRLRFGALRDLIIGITLALPDGTLASSGGKVVKNVAGYDLPKLSTGALGTLGVITRAVFRLHPLPQNSSTFSITTSDAHAAQLAILAIQNSTLAHSALQTVFSSDAPPQISIRFEGTPPGIAAQESRLRSLIAPIQLAPASSELWSARQQLFDSISPATAHDSEITAIAKISLLPADLSATLSFIAQHAPTKNWRVVIQATGLGHLFLSAPAASIADFLKSLRANLHRASGSLVIAESSPRLANFDVWGDPGDALPLMRSVKHQLDPFNTLNPGRFVGGI